MKLSSLALVLFLGLSGCVRTEATTRTERGPLLRTFHRNQVLEGGVSADVRVTWPTLKLTMVGHDTCRDQEVEEYAEDHITEHSVPSAGPSFSIGTIGTIAAATLFAVSYAVSNTPDRTRIDQAGNYGPSLGTTLRVWSAVSLGVGLPSLVVGIISAIRAGEDTQRVKSEQVANQHDVACNERPITGPVTLQTDHGPLASKPAVDGAVDFEAAELKPALDKLGATELEGLVFYGRGVVVDEQARAALDAFSACLQVDGPFEVAGASEPSLLRRAESLRACRPARGDAVAAPLKAVDDELEKRRAGGAAPGAFSPRAEVTSFEEAVSAWNPRLRFKADSADLARLDNPASIEGQAALVEGVVSEGLTQNIGVLQLGPRELFVFLPPKRAWGFDFGNGTRIEAVVVMSGSQTVGERTLPLARAVWMRPLF